MYIVKCYFAIFVLNNYKQNCANNIAYFSHHYVDNMLHMTHMYRNNIEHFSQNYVDHILHI